MFSEFAVICKSRNKCFAVLKFKVPGMILFRYHTTFSFILKLICCLATAIRGLSYRFWINSSKQNTYFRAERRNPKHARNKNEQPQSYNPKFPSGNTPNSHTDKLLTWQIPSSISNQLPVSLFASGTVPMANLSTGEFHIAVDLPGGIPQAPRVRRNTALPYPSPLYPNANSVFSIDDVRIFVRN